jgi:hypothetical protein
MGGYLMLVGYMHLQSVQLHNAQVAAVHSLDYQIVL